MSSTDDFKIFVDGFKAGAAGREGFTNEQVDSLLSRVNTIFDELKDDNRRLRDENESLRVHLAQARGIASDGPQATLVPVTPETAPVALPEPVVADPVVVEPVVSDPAPVIEHEEPETQA